MGINENVFTFPSIRHEYLPMIAVLTTPTAMYGKTVFGKLHTKFQNISKFSLRGHFKNECYNFYTYSVIVAA